MPSESTSNKKYNKNNHRLARQNLCSINESSGNLTPVLKPLPATTRRKFLKYAGISAIGTASLPAIAASWWNYVQALDYNYVSGAFSYGWKFSYSIGSSQSHAALVTDMPIGDFYDWKAAWSTREDHWVIPGVLQQQHSPQFCAFAVGVSVVRKLNPSSTLTQCHLASLYNQGDGSPKTNLGYDCCDLRNAETDETLGYCRGTGPVVGTERMFKMYTYCNLGMETSEIGLPRSIQEIKFWLSGGQNHVTNGYTHYIPFEIQWKETYIYINPKTKSRETKTRDRFHEGMIYGIADENAKTLLVGDPDIGAHTIGFDESAGQFVSDNSNPYYQFNNGLKITMSWRLNKK